MKKHGTYDVTKARTQMHMNAARDRHLAAGTTGSRLSLDKGHGTHIMLLKNYYYY